MLLLGEKRLSKKRIWTLAATGTEHNATWRLRDTSRAQTNSSRTKAAEQAWADAVSETLRVGKATGAFSLNTRNFRRAREVSEQPDVEWRSLGHVRVAQDRVAHQLQSRCAPAPVSRVDHIPGWDHRPSKQKEPLVHDLANPSGPYLSWKRACSATSLKNDDMI